MYDGNPCIDILKDLCLWISLICPNGDVDYVDYVQIKKNNKSTLDNSH